jgi:hypothetical protein
MLVNSHRRPSTAKSNGDTPDNDVSYYMEQVKQMTCYGRAPNKSWSIGLLFSLGLGS